MSGISTSLVFEPCKYCDGEVRVDVEKKIYAITTLGELLDEIDTHAVYQCNKCSYRRWFNDTELIDKK